MKKPVYFLLSILYMNLVQAQVDTINTKTNILDINRLSEGKTSYIVYIQDSIFKSNFEIWERSIVKNKYDYQLKWKRYTNDKNNFYDYLITFDEKLRTLSEKVIHQELKEGTYRLEKKHFIYEGERMFSNTDTIQHNTAYFQIEDLKHSFNWEIDLEVLATLPLADFKQFDISFYHPSSKTPPQYYHYWVDRSEELIFNQNKMDCWVVKVIYSKKHSSEFWIDKSSHIVLQMKESFFGKNRFKKIIL